MRTLKLGSLSFLVAFAAGCLPKEEGQPTDTIGETETSTSEPQNVTETAGETVAETIGETEAETEADTESETIGETEADTEGETVGETEADTDVGEMPNPLCGEQDPAVSAAFHLALAGLNDHDSYEIDAPCVVGEVVVEADKVVTHLTCEVEGAPQEATLSLPVAPEGAVAWAAGAEVRVVGDSQFDSELQLGYFRRFSLRDAETDELLAAGVQHEFLSEKVFAPLVVETVFACGPEGDGFVDPPAPMAIAFSRGEQPPLEVIGGHRDALAIDAGQAYAIDVAEASMNNCCHYARWHHVLVRKVQSGG